jgi:hypothetical protein
MKDGLLGTATWDFFHPELQTLYNQLCCQRPHGCLCIYPVMTGRLSKLLLWLPRYGGGARKAMPYALIR